MDSKPVLAFDCATMGASIALWVDGQIFSGMLSQHRQSAELVAKIDELLHKTGVKYPDLRAIIATRGPGSFTGVRVGLATLHGLALAAGVPVKTLTSLDAIAREVASEPTAPTEFFVTLRAGKGEVYAQQFAVSRGTVRVCGDIFLAPETKTDWPLPTISDRQPNADFLCTLADMVEDTPLAAALPVYVRPPDAKLPNAPGALPRA